jgi:hypothetical protein
MSPAMQGKAKANIEFVSQRFANRRRSIEPINVD